MTTETKVCTKCGKEKPLSEFGWADKKKGYLRSACKACVNAHAKAYREANPEKHKAAVARWAKENRKKRNAYRRAWHKKHKEENNAKARAYYEEHREEILQHKNEYYWEHHDEIRARQKRQYHYNRRYKNLTREQQLKLFEENIGLVHHMANKYYIEPAFKDDLIQEGMIGLMKGIQALQNFDPRKCALSTILCRYIQSNMRIYLFKAMNRSGLSGSLKPVEQALKLRDKSVKELSKEDREKLVLATTCSRFDAPVKDDSETTLENFYGKEDKLYDGLPEAIAKLLSNLDHRSRDVICRYYGIGRPEETQVSIAESYGLSPQMICVIVSTSLEKLRELPGTSSLAVYL